MTLINLDSDHLQRREEKLKIWAFQTLGLEANTDWRPVSGDASFRRYFRIESDLQCSTSLQIKKTFIAVDSPPETENNIAFLDILQRLSDANVCVPEKLAVNLLEGYMLLSDFGDRLLLQALNDSSAEALYTVAMDVLLPMQACEHSGLPAYGQKALRDELTLFDEWLLTQYLGLSIDTSTQQNLNQLYSQLEQVALSQPKCFVHRDYHPRNIMMLTDAKSPLGIIDFQDAVVGPITYDLVSLLKNSYHKFSLERVDQWSLDYRDRLIKAGKIEEQNVPIALWNRWFDWMGLQRHLKVAGIFARLYLRDGKAGFLNDIPRTVSFILEMTERYCSEFEWFHQFMQAQVVPALIKKNPAATQWLNKS